MKNKKSKILLSLLAPVGALSVVSTAALSLASCNDKTNATISVVDAEGKASSSVTVKYSNAKLNTYSSIQLSWPDTHSIQVLEVKVGGKALKEDKYTVQKGIITITPEAMTSTDVVIKTKITEMPTSLLVTGIAEFKQGEFFGAEDIVVRAKNTKAETSDPLKWGKDYTISYGGSIIENFDTVGFYFDKQMKLGTHSFTIKYLGESAAPISCIWTITLKEDPQLTVDEISVSLKRGSNIVYSDETLTDADFDVKLIYSDKHEEEAWYGYDYYIDQVFPITAADAAKGITFTYIGDTSKSKTITPTIENRELLGFIIDETPVNIFTNDVLKSSYFDIKCRFDKGEPRTAVIGGDKDYIIKYGDNNYSDWGAIKLLKPQEAIIEIIGNKSKEREGAVNVTVNPTYTFEWDSILTGYKAKISSFTSKNANHMMKLEVPCDYIDTKTTKFTIDTNGSYQFTGMEDTISKSLTVYKNSIWTAPISSSNIVFDSEAKTLTFNTDLTGFNTTDKLVITFEVPRLASFSQADWYFNEAE